MINFKSNIKSKFLFFITLIELFLVLKLQASYNIIHKQNFIKLITKKNLPTVD